MFLLAVSITASLAGCTVSSSTTSFPANVAIAITSSPSSVQAGQTAQFTATVSNSASSGVIWEVDSIVGGSAATGTISASGLYTAPETPPSPSTVTILASAAGDTKAIATASLTISPAVSVTIQAPAETSLGPKMSETFIADVMNATDTSVKWSVNSVLGGSAATGTITAAGVYTAPTTLAARAAVTITAVSNQDANQSASQQLTLVPLTLTISAPTYQVKTGATDQFTPTVMNAVDSSVTWEVETIAGGNSTVGTISPTGLYTAPATVPSPATVTISAVSNEDPTIMGSQSVMLSLTPPPVAVTVTPGPVNIGVAGTQQFNASVKNLPAGGDSTVSWYVNDVLGGPTDGTVGTITAGGFYTAPTTIPNPASVTVKAVSNQDHTAIGSVMFSIVNNIMVSVSGPNSNLFVNQSETLTASVTMVSQTGVLWSLSCAGGACGSINPTPTTTSDTATYIAPAGVPGGGQTGTVTVTAMSLFDTTKTGSFQITISTVPTPLVTIMGPSKLVLGMPAMYTATVTAEPGQSTNVTWTLQCINSDDSMDGCASDDNEGAGGLDGFSLSPAPGAPSTTVTLIVPTQNPDEGTITVNLTATTVAKGSDGTPGTKTVTVTLTPP